MPKHATQKEKERWWALYQKGTTLKAISQRCGFSYQIVARYVGDRRCVEAIPDMSQVQPQDVEP